MKHRLFLIEGLPCSGKSTTSDFVASCLSKYAPVSLVDEGTRNHPADYEFHALAPAGLISDREQIVALSDFSGEMFEKLLQFKIYDFLPWEKEMPLMLEKWRQFTASCDAETVHVFNCVFLQNPMCETMMRFGFSEDESGVYIGNIAEIIRPLDPVVLYLKNTDIAETVHKTAAERPGWLDAVIDYHVNGKYGKQIGAEGFEGYIQCLQERQTRELRILERLPVTSIVIENPQKNWELARSRISAYLDSL